eukprot:TRINITY_DN11081_c0_g1_i1.p1 TRINITY_DN11081_c0_g1~~TRINITY_DN11081_c0_g1_i1.p1  ORF type:complete len:506 (+),score=173.53 TRINITY_DN11081_c0_g1_i1:142-1659(+)
MEANWYYLSESDQHGPLPFEAITDLIDDEQLTAYSQVWHDQSPNWMAVWQCKELEHLGEKVQIPIEEKKKFEEEAKKAQAKMWYFLDDSHQRQGPIQESSFPGYFEAGQLDGMSLVWNVTLEDWKSIAEVPHLKEMLQSSVAIEDDDEEPENIIEGVYEGPKTESEKRYTTAEGTKFEWNEEEKQFEKVSEFSTSVGENVETAKPEDTKNQEGEQKNNNSENKNENGKNPVKRKRKRKKKEGWVKKKNHNWIYVTGLPSDVTENELLEFFKRCGAIMGDIFNNNKPRIKLYRDEMGESKGDAKLCFVKPEAVEMAINMLDGGVFREDGTRIKVTKADFQPYTDARAEGLKKRKHTKEDIIKIRRATTQALSWDTTAGRRQDMVVILHLHEPKDFEENADAVKQQLHDDIFLECSKIGEVSKVTVFDRNEEGAVIVKYKNADHAENCVAKMDGRFFGGKPLKSILWDGITNYKVEKVETEEDEERRHLAFQKWVDEQGGEEAEGDE